MLECFAHISVVKIVDFFELPESIVTSTFNLTHRSNFKLTRLP
ncbi:UNVERIFIED_ORG: hypothetical protein ABIB63_003159 [Xanthomonas axonopodis]